MAQHGNGRAAESNGKAAQRTPAGATYDAFKNFEGKRYTGMKVGRGHKWNYEAGEWTEKKVTPDKWEFRYAVHKRRKGRAPEGSADRHKARRKQLRDGHGRHEAQAFAQARR
jgi:hypothetical protein